MSPVLSAGEKPVTATNPTKLTRRKRQHDLRNDFSISLFVPGPVIVEAIRITPGGLAHDPLGQPCAVEATTTCGRHRARLYLHASGTLVLPGVLTGLGMEPAFRAALAAALVTGDVA